MQNTLRPSELENAFIDYGLQGHELGQRMQSARESVAAAQLINSLNMLEEFTVQVCARRECPSAPGCRTAQWLVLVQCYDGSRVILGQY